ncbi:MAG: thioredoxin family protein [Calditrichia bacterium]
MNKIIFLILLLALPMLAGDEESAPTIWLETLEAAKEHVADSDKLIMLYFSGSDWCRPCIQLKKVVLETDAFKAYAADNLALVMLDFPAKKKNKLSAERTAYNEGLAERFNKKGSFPLVVLINSNEENVATLGGYREETPEAYISKIKKAISK